MKPIARSDWSWFSERFVRPPRRQRLLHFHFWQLAVDYPVRIVFDGQPRPSASQLSPLQQQLAAMAAGYGVAGAGPGAFRDTNFLRRIAGAIERPGVGYPGKNTPGR